MKNLFNNMDSSEVGRILEMHKNQGYSLSEQVKPVNTEAGKKALEKAAQALSNDKSLGIPGRNDNTTSSMQYKDMKIPETINIGSSLFKNGIADIDRNNTGYKDAIVKLKKIPSDITINIIGGASAVGSDRGFNNQKLAMLRATNFIKAAQSDGVKVVMTPSSEVGVSKEKNSPAAEAEQFVKILFNKEGDLYAKEAQDKTSVDKKRGGNAIPDDEDIIKGGGGHLFKMCIGDLTATEYMELLKRFKNKIKSRGVQ